MLFNPAIERLPLPRLRALQHARLKEQVAYAYDRVPFYQQQFDALGIHSATFRGLKALGKLSFTKKTDFRDNYPFGLFAVPENEVARLHYSSGTTGKRWSATRAVTSKFSPKWWCGRSFTPLFRHAELAEASWLVS